MPRTEKMLKLVLNGSFVMTIPALIGAIYNGGVNDDIIQNAIPIATNTILIISYLRSGLFVGNTPGWSRDFTLIY